MLGSGIISVVSTVGQVIAGSLIFISLIGVISCVLVAKDKDKDKE
jgi:hypothetical protein